MRFILEVWVYGDLQDVARDLPVSIDTAVSEYASMDSACAIGAARTQFRLPDTQSCCAGTSQYKKKLGASRIDTVFDSNGRNRVAE